MLLRYPITSYASHYVDLTGGLLTRFEDRIIDFCSRIFGRKSYRYDTLIMSEGEMAKLGLSKSDLGIKSSEKTE